MQNLTTEDTEVHRVMGQKGSLFGVHALACQVCRDFNDTLKREHRTGFKKS